MACSTNGWQDREFIAGAYSIADMASYPWILRLEREATHLEGFTLLRRWYNAISERPATLRAYEIGKTINATPTVTEESKAILLGQNGGKAAA